MDAGGVDAAGVLEGVVPDGVVPDGVDAVGMDGVVVPPEDVAVPLPELAPVADGGVVEPTVAGVVVAGGDAGGVVAGVVLDAVEPVPVADGVDVAAGDLLSVGAAPFLPQMSSFETLPAVDGVVDGVVVAGGDVATGAGVVAALVFAPLFAASCRSFSFF